MPSATTIEKTTFRSGPWQEIFAQGVQVDDHLYLAGQTSLDDDGDVVGEGDIATQFARTYANVTAVLAHFGADMSNVVDETIYVTDFAEVMGNIEAVAGARAEAYGGVADVAQAMVEVQGLVMPELAVEIRCTARLG